MPINVIDLYCELRNLTNGKGVFLGADGKERPPGLIDGLRYFNLPAMESTEKRRMRELAIRGGPFTGDEREALMAYVRKGL